MHTNRAQRRLNATSIVLLPLLLSGCLMNESTESDAINTAPAPPPVNDAPVITGTPPRMGKVGVEYAFTPNASDPNGDAISFSIENRPNWANFNPGNGRLSGIPTLGSEGTYNDVLIKANDGQMTSELPMFSITVEPAEAPNMPPEISGNGAAGITVGNAYSFTPSASDPDGDTLTFSATNRPGWLSINRSTGELSGIPQLGDVGVYADIAVNVTDGQSSASTPAFTITVAANNSAPTISGTPAESVTVGDSYMFLPTSDDDDNDELTFTITNKPSWATFWSGQGRLFGDPTAADVGTYNDIVIEVSDGEETATLPAFSITVEAAPVVNNRPTISGTPNNAVTVGNNYSFTPQAADPDGDTLSFSIQGKPDWASFNPNNGRLQGTPTASDTGTYSNVRISVSDGDLSASLGAFSITVNAAPVVNSRPIISGTPDTDVVAGTAYSFTPQANDPDGDNLTFSIQGKPGWANFNTSTGRLSGTPSTGNVGTYSNIRITVSDGDLSATLPAFSVTVSQPAASTGSVTLNWTPPTQNTDGSSLTDLAAYRIYYGTSQGNYPNSITLNNPGLSSYTVEDLVPGTYYFVSTAINSDGVESDYSNVAQKVVSP